MILDLLAGSSARLARLARRVRNSHPARHDQFQSDACVPRCYRWNAAQEAEVETADPRSSTLISGDEWRLAVSNSFFAGACGELAPPSMAIGFHISGIPVNEPWIRNGDERESSHGRLVPELVQVLHARHWDIESPALVLDFKVADVETDNAHRRSLGQAFREFATIKAASDFCDLAHVIDPLFVFHPARLSEPLGHWLSEAGEKSSEGPEVCFGVIPE